jgi:hypothetical protein
MNADDVRKIRDHAATPAAGNNVLGAIRRLVRFGMKMTPPMLTATRR